MRQINNEFRTFGRRTATLTRLLLLTLALPLFVHGAETNAFAQDKNRILDRIAAVLPKKGWKVEDRGDSLFIIGPKVRTLFHVSLPAEETNKLWQEYSRTELVNMSIEFQGSISDADLAELKGLQERFGKIMEHINRGINHLGKDGDEHVREFGQVRLPDYRSTSSSIFVTDNVAAKGNSPLEVDSPAAQEVVRKIYSIIEEYCRNDVAGKKDKSAATNSVPRN